MWTKTYPLWNKDEYTFQNIVPFQPTITCYIQENSKNRPAIIIVPGGGYCLVSSTEGEIVAEDFFAKGYNTFVVTYTTNLLMDHPLKLQPLQDLARSVQFVRQNASLFGIDPNKIIVCGFSAGAHLCGSLAVHYDDVRLFAGEPYEGISIRPDAVLLCYPVITTGSYAHSNSFRALLGDNATTDEMQYMSLEQHVSETTPPTFLWHSVTDELVPMENSLLFFSACKEKAVPTELHLFGHGCHGQSLANEKWASGDCGGDYTMTQFFDIMQFLIDHEMELPAPYNAYGKLPAGTNMKALYMNSIGAFRGNNHADSALAAWPKLANRWLQGIFALDHSKN